MSDSAPRMMVLSPHPDDGILGAGGTMARFIAAGGDVTVVTITAHMPPLFTTKTFQRSMEETRDAHSIIGVKDAIFLNRAALSLQKTPQEELNTELSEVLARVQPDILAIPFLDRNSDHRAVFESALVAARPLGKGHAPTLVAAYEVLSSTHWNAAYLEPNFTPNWIVDITGHVDIKLQALQRCTEQMRAYPHPRSPETARALAQFRGTQVAVRYGEAFCVVNMTVLPEILANGRAGERSKASEQVEDS